MNRIRACRKMRDMTLKEIAVDLGVSESAVSLYESGKRNPNIETMIKIAGILDVSLNQLIGRESDESGGVRIPVLGNVAAGIPIQAIEEVLDYEEITASLAASGEFFALKIRGDSMEPRMNSGDVVIVRQQSDVDSGQIAVVFVGRENATVKRLVKRNDGILLVSANPKYEPMFFSKKDVYALPITVLGRVVELRAKF